MTLAELLERQGIVLPRPQLVQLDWLAAELLRWNRRRNLTAITAPEQVLEKHLVDSLSLLPEAESAAMLLDLGSGAGFPALPLKIACPALPIVSVEAVAKKVAFQRHVARSLGLAALTALHCRAEDLAQEACYRARFDLVTARALGDLSWLVALAEPFLTPHGRLIAMKGPEAERELTTSAEALEAGGWQVAMRRFELPLSGAVRCLLEVRRKGSKY